MSTDALVIKDSMKILNLTSNCPQFYAFPWSKITKLNENRIELYHQDIYEPVSIIKMNINDKNISYKKWIPTTLTENSPITNNWDKNKEWYDQQYDKIKKLNTVHCECCSDHKYYSELSNTIETLTCSSIPLKKICII